jgi:hypothetical protein
MRPERGDRLRRKRDRATAFGGLGLLQGGLVADEHEGLAHREPGTIEYHQAIETEPSRKLSSSLFSGTVSMNSSRSSSNTYRYANNNNGKGLTDRLGRGSMP